MNGPLPDDDALSAFEADCIADAVALLSAGFDIDPAEVAMAPFIEGPALMRAVRLAALTAIARAALDAAADARGVPAESYLQQIAADAAEAR